MHNTGRCIICAISPWSKSSWGAAGSVTLQTEGRRFCWSGKRDEPQVGSPEIESKNYFMDEAGDPTLFGTRAIPGTPYTILSTVIGVDLLVGEKVRASFGFSRRAGKGWGDQAHGGEQAR